MNAAHITETLAELGARFEAALEAFAAAGARETTPNLHDAMAYALGLDLPRGAARGKRIRPALCLLACRSLGGDLDAATPFALAIELMHNFCLAHDDIEDGDTMRRGRPSLWRRFGTPHAINAGDYILVQAVRALAEEAPEALDDATRLRLIRLFGLALDRTHIGQALDMNARDAREFTTADYLRLAREKTGFYLAAPIQGGALVAGADDAVLAALGEMAQFLGPMFQIMDDVIDLTEGKGRDAWGSDIREGKRSFMVAHAGGVCSVAEREALFDILDKPRDATTAEDVKWAADLFARAGSMEAGREACRELRESSRAALDRLPRALAADLDQLFETLARRES